MSHAPGERPTHLDPFLLAMALYAGLVLLVFTHQLFPELGARGVIASEGMLAAELHADEDTPWGLGLLEPYCYRPAFRALVLAFWAGLGGGEATFYGVFVTLGALSLLGAAWAFHLLLGRLGFDARHTRLGVALFLLGFPALFAYDIPIHTREDLLGYAAIALTLVFVARDEAVPVAILGALGATVRETCLLGVLPFALVSRRPWPQRLLAYAPGAVAWLGVRAAQGPPGGSRYEYVSISTAPLFERPGEAALYLFATFGALWVAAALRLFADPRPPRHPLLARRVVLLAVGAVAATGWTMGMIREARITYVLFPFIIPLALDLLGSARARAAARTRAAWTAGLLVLGVGAAGIGLLIADPEGHIPALREVIGENFNPGALQVLELPPEDGDVVVLEEPVFASRWNGPHVLLHAAASAFLLAGWAATRPTPAQVTPAS